MQPLPHTLLPGQAMPTLGPIPPAPPGHSWESLMDEALELAHAAERNGEVPVGALIAAPDGRIVGRGCNAPIASHDPTAHAEVQAIRDAGRNLGNYRLDGCVLVVTLEPCAMCAAAMVHARIAGVVFGAADPLAGSVLSRTDLLDAPFFNHRVWHMGGISSERCAGQLRDFFLARR